MRGTQLSIPELVLFGVTRGMIGAGIGLLLSSRFRRQRRIAVGWTLLSIGALSTIPLAFEVFGRERRVHDGQSRAPGLARFSDTVA